MTKTGSPLRVYTLDDLPPEVVAVAFAKTSRSPDSFEEIARELSESESSRFHERWVIGYGHSSVAEHAVLSIAVENVSILGAKAVEESRLSSFTEKSTRYQVMEAANHYTPPPFAAGKAGALYRETVAALYRTYEELLPEARRWCDRHYGSDAWKTLGVNPKGKACDAVRGLLPAAAKTNLGWTTNARTLRHTIVKLASSPLAELRDLADELRRVGLARTPTLLKYTDPSPYIEGWEARVAAGTAPGAGSASVTGSAPLAGSAPARSSAPVRDGQDASSTPEAPGGRLAAADGSEVRLVAYDADAEAAVVSAILFRSGRSSYEDVRARVAAMRPEERIDVVRRALAGMTEHESPVREFEHASYTFEVTCDFGAFRDIQRHRMTTQTQQPLTCELGYVVPTDAVAAGLGDRLAEALDAAGQAWQRLAETDLLHAQYAVPLAYRKRFLMRMDLRELFYLVRLRSKVQGHESYRRVACRMKREVARVHPALAALVPADQIDEGDCETAGESAPVGEERR